MKTTSRRKSRKFFANFFRSRKKLIRLSLVTANLAVLGLVWFVVSKAPANHSPIRLSASASPLTQDTLTGPLDQVSSADIAVHIARVAGLPETVSVTNHADSVSAAAVTGPADNAIVAKPQVAGGVLPTYKDIQRYTTVDGDTVASIAAKLGVSSDSIRWSNNLTGNTIAAGRQLVVPPSGMNGIVYSVKAGDTPDSLAQRFNANKEAIIDINDADVAGLKVGTQIVIPNGIIQAAPVARATYATFAWGSGAVYGANGYDYGWCTWHAANRRRETGRPIPSNLGNAISWYYVARNSGMAVGDAPAAGAVLWHARMGGLGHVAYVEKINDDGSLMVSDMNYPIWGRVTYRTVPPSEFGQYKFIY